jgi:hypothetical protein
MIMNEDAFDHQSSGVDWAAVLDSIADALAGLAQRVEDLEARVGNNNNNNNNNKSETEVLDLPTFLAPRHGEALGMPGLRFSPPLAAKSR